MNENDTFEALRRTPFLKLQELMQEDDYSFDSPIYMNFSEYEVNFLIRHGWSVIEFKKAWRDDALKENPKIIEYPWWNEFVDQCND